MMAVVCDGRREIPDGGKRDYSSYCGNYTFDGKQLITRVDAASDPARIGSDQVRDVRFEQGLMVLRPAGSHLWRIGGAAGIVLGEDRRRVTVTARVWNDRR